MMRLLKNPILFLLSPFSTVHCLKKPNPRILVDQNIKANAKKWFIKRAEKSGIPWTQFVNTYKNNIELIQSYKDKYENTSLVYPNYYLQPFHGYDSGNMDWDSAVEVKSATYSISSRYWKNIDPYTAEQWMRNNATNAIQSYLSHQTDLTVKTIMDMGSSTGISTNYLQHAFPESTILGVELSPYFLSIALYESDLASDNLHYLHANAENVPLPDGCFDMITCQFLLHEVPYYNTLAILKEAHRLLKVDGVLAILDLNPNSVKARLQGNLFRQWAFERTEPHIHDYYNHDMKQTMYECGFESVVQTKNDPLNSLWVGKKTGVKIQTPKLVKYRHVEQPPFDSRKKSNLCPFPCPSLRK